MKKKKRKETGTRLSFGTLKNKQVDAWLKKSVEGPCFFGMDNPVLKHGNVELICRKYPEPRAVCSMHGHSGEECCSWIGWVKTNGVHPEKGKEKDMSHSSRKNKKARCAGSSSCREVADYRCSKRTGLYCWKHAHPYNDHCCRLIPLVADTHFERYPASKMDDVEESEKKSIFHCEKKGCSSTDSPYYCKRKDKWLCTICRHDRECCKHYEMGSGSEEREPEKPLKEVKFATID